ncbi:glutathione peroxidase [bacterium]|nr:glutathione peroxidase [bacterium]
MIKSVFKSFLCVSVFFTAHLNTAYAAKKGHAMLLNQTTTLLNGQKINLNDFAGKVILFVNTASYCGYTSQYKELQQLHERYETQGFTVIAIPCNNFGNQEPGTAEEIKQFLAEKGYTVTFPILSKRDALGDEQSDLFHQLTQMAPKDGKSIDVQWNFEKFLVNRKQEVVARFRSSTDPMDAKILTAIEKALKDTP